MAPGIAVFVLGLAVLVRVVGIGPWEEDEGSPVATDSASGPTTSTTGALAARNYKTGDCVTWDQSPTAPTYLHTDVVDCDEPHLFEITGRVDGAKRFSQDYPSQAAWDELEAQECVRLAERHLRGPLDPEGRFHTSSLIPPATAPGRGSRG
jgi:hypothetical protein